LNSDLILRLRRRAVASCAAIAVVAWTISRDPWMPVAVLGGGLLIGISFASIATGVDAIAARRSAGLAVLAIAGRYALLAFLGYGMIARLRLSRVGLIAGASSGALAAAFEAASLLRKQR
jgi:hypothetical protein